jgi:hypothetical protein
MRCEWSLVIFTVFNIIDFLAYFNRVKVCQLKLAKTHFFDNLTKSTGNIHFLKKLYKITST